MYANEHRNQESGVSHDPIDVVSKPRARTRDDDLPRQDHQHRDMSRARASLHDNVGHVPDVQESLVEYHQHDAVCRAIRTQGERVPDACGPARACHLLHAFESIGSSVVAHESAQVVYEDTVRCVESRV